MEFMLDSCLSFCHCWNWSRFPMNRELYEPLLSSQHSEISSDADSIGSDPLCMKVDQESVESIKSQIASGDSCLQQQAARRFCYLVQNDPGSIKQNLLDLLVLFLKVENTEVEKLVIFTATKVLPIIDINDSETISKSGLLIYFFKFLSSNDIEVQNNTLRCIILLTNLPVQKMELVSHGAVKLILSLTQSTHTGIQSNALCALFNLSLLEAACDEMAANDAVLILSRCLTAEDHEKQFYAVAIIANMATLKKHRDLMLNYGSNDIVRALVKILIMSDDKIKCQASLALRNLSTEESVQVLIVQLGSLTVFEQMLGEETTACAALACLHNLSIAKQNELLLVSPNLLLKILHHLLSTNLEVQYHVVSIIRNLASGQFTQALLNSGCSFGLVQLLVDNKTPEAAQVEVTAALANLSMNENVKSLILSFNDNEALYAVLKLGLMYSHLPQLQYHCAGILSNLCTSGLPQGIMKSSYLFDFLNSLLNKSDTKFVHIALWIIVHLFKDEQFVICFPKKFNIQKLQDLILTSNGQIKYLVATIMLKL